MVTPGVEVEYAGFGCYKNYSGLASETLGHIINNVVSVQAGNLSHVRMMMKLCDPDPTCQGINILQNKAAQTLKYIEVRTGPSQAAQLKFMMVLLLLLLLWLEGLAHGSLLPFLLHGIECGLLTICGLSLPAVLHT